MCDLIESFENLSLSENNNRKKDNISKSTRKTLVDDFQKANTLAAIQQCIKQDPQHVLLSSSHFFKSAFQPGVAPYSTSDPPPSSSSSSSSSSSPLLYSSAYLFPPSTQPPKQLHKKKPTDTLPTSLRFSLQATALSLLLPTSRFEDLSLIEAALHALCMSLAAHRSESLVLPAPFKLDIATSLSHASRCVSSLPPQLSLRLLSAVSSLLRALGKEQLLWAREILALAMAQVQRDPELWQPLRRELVALALSCPAFSPHLGQLLAAQAVALHKQGRLEHCVALSELACLLHHQMATLWDQLARTYLQCKPANPLALHAVLMAIYLQVATEQAPSEALLRNLKICEALFPQSDVAEKMASIHQGVAGLAPFFQKHPETELLFAASSDFALQHASELLLPTQSTTRQSAKTKQSIDSKQSSPAKPAAESTRSFFPWNDTHWINVLYLLQKTCASIVNVNQIERRLFKLQPPSPDEWAQHCLDRATLAYAQGQHHQALGWHRKIIAKSSLSPFYLAEAHLWAGHISLALHGQTDNQSKPTSKPIPSSSTSSSTLSTPTSTSTSTSSSTSSNSLLNPDECDHSLIRGLELLFPIPDLKIDQFPSPQRFHSTSKILKLATYRFRVLYDPVHEEMARHLTRRMLSSAAPPSTDGSTELLCEEAELAYRRGAAFSEEEDFLSALPSSEETLAQLPATARYSAVVALMDSRRWDRAMAMLKLWKQSTRSDDCEDVHKAVYALAVAVCKYRLGFPGEAVGHCHRAVGLLRGWAAANVRASAAQSAGKVRRVAASRWQVLEYLLQAWKTWGDALEALGLQRAVAAYRSGLEEAQKNNCRRYGEYFRMLISRVQLQAGAPQVEVAGDASAQATLDLDSYYATISAELDYVQSRLANRQTEHCVEIYRSLCANNNKRNWCQPVALKRLVKCHQGEQHPEFILQLAQIFQSKEERHFDRLVAGLALLECHPSFHGLPIESSSTPSSSSSISSSSTSSSSSSTPLRRSTRSTSTTTAAPKTRKVPVARTTPRSASVQPEVKPFSEPSSPSIDFEALFDEILNGAERGFSSLGKLEETVYRRLCLLKAGICSASNDSDALESDGSPLCSVADARSSRWAWQSAFYGNASLAASLCERSVAGHHLWRKDFQIPRLESWAKLEDLSRDLLPSGWSAVSVAQLRDDVVLVSRLCGELSEPVNLYFRVPQMANLRKLYDGVKQLLSQAGKIKTGGSREEKERWKALIKKADAQLASLAKQLSDAFFPFHRIFEGVPESHHQTAELQKQRNALVQSIAKATKVPADFVKVFLCPCLAPIHNANDDDDDDDGSDDNDDAGDDDDAFIQTVALLKPMFPDVEVPSERQVQRWRATYRKQSNEGKGKRHPVVLVLDKGLHVFPWEGMAGLEGQSVGRMLSLDLLRAMLVRHRGQGGCGYEKGFFVIDPTDEFVQTQQKFAADFAGRGWHGIAGKAQAPEREEFKRRWTEGVKGADVVLYFGHNAGEKIVPPEGLEEIESRATVILMGCSSAHLRFDGEYGPTSATLGYLLAGCRNVVGNLWQVLTEDIDQYAESMLRNLFDRKMPIGVAIAEAKVKTKMATKAIVKFAPVLYGLPDFV